MRARLIILLVAILLVAGFAALNWSEILQPMPLSFGIFTMSAPLGLILLSITALTLVAFLISTAHLQTVSLLDYRQHTKELQAQRELADKAEASRFTDLRQHMDAQLREIQQGGQPGGTEFEKSVTQNQRELRTQLELMNKTLATRLADIESRLDGRPGQRARAPGDSTILS
jgi:hypothetical protein